VVDHFSIGKNADLFFFLGLGRRPLQCGTASSHHAPHTHTQAPWRSEIKVMPFLVPHSHGNGELAEIAKHGDGHLLIGNSKSAFGGGCQMLEFETPQATHTKAKYRSG